MKWVVDNTGRFGWRPHYTPEELDNECEQTVNEFLLVKHGVIRFPLSTDDLSILVERDTSDLDLFSDMTSDGDDIEGATDFFPHKKPAVKISRTLSTDNAKYLRLRTTLAHEYAHVRLHNFLWGLTAPQKPAINLVRKIVSQRQKMQRLRHKLNPESGSLQSDSIDQSMLSLINTRKMFICPKGLILQSPDSDWMEWQAGYACGAFLMPASRIRNIVDKRVAQRLEQMSVFADPLQAANLVTTVAGEFDVSIDAAQVRLEKLGILSRTKGELA